MTPTEALARIAAHCDELETDAHPGRLIAQVRAVLAEVTPETGGTLDRDQARDALRPFVLRALLEEALDALAGCVRPATIDRVALARAWDEGYANGAHSTVEEDAANGNLSFDNPYAGRKATQ